MQVTLQQTHKKELVNHGEQEFTIPTFWQHDLNVQTFFSTLPTHFKMISKSFKNAFLLLYCVIYMYIIAMLISVGPSKHVIFYFFGAKLPASVVKVPAMPKKIYTGHSTIQPVN